MTNPISALQPGPLREPVAPAAQAPKELAPVLKKAELDDVEKTSKSTEKQKSDALDEINNALKMASIGVRFEFDKDANIMVTKVMDVESGEMIRQMPTEEVVRISKAMGKLQGLLVSQKV